MVMTVEEEEEEGVGRGRGVGISGGGDEARSMALRNMMTERVISRGMRMVESAMCDSAILLIDDVGDDRPPPPSSSSSPGDGDNDGKRRRDGKWEARTRCSATTQQPTKQSMCDEMRKGARRNDEARRDKTTRRRDDVS